MGINKIFIYIISALILSGCVQSTAMVGPALTLASTGNISQAGVTFFTNKAVKEETGMDTVSYVSNKLEQNSSKNRKFRKLVETICSMTNTPFKDIVKIDDDRLGKDQSYLLDSSAIRKALKWSDLISLEEGLHETLSWVDANLELLSKLPWTYTHKT